MSDYQLIGEYVCVRSPEAGVFIGILRQFGADRMVILTKSEEGETPCKGVRNIHRWEGRNTLAEVCLYGLEKARISEPSEFRMVGPVCDILVPTEVARLSFEEGTWNI